MPMTYVLRAIESELWLFKMTQLSRWTTIDTRYLRVLGGDQFITMET